MKKITAIVTAVIGILVIILGATLMGESGTYAPDENYFRYTAKDFDASYATFGGDFYTYIYGAADTIVDQLDAINGAMETVIKAQNSINEAVTANAQATDSLIGAVHHVGGMVVIAIGLMILSGGVQKLGDAFTGGEEKKYAPQPVAAYQPAPQEPIAQEAEPQDPIEV